MIMDRIKNAALYYGISPRIEKALKYLESHDLRNLEAGRYEIDGDRIFMLVQEYETKPADKGRWEAHREYYDIQYLVEGMEYMGYAFIDTVEVTEPYNPDKDILRFAGSGNMILCHPGTFAIFGPDDAHMPNMAVEQPAPARKIVVKVKIQDS